jgi:hypothetical protein
VAINALNILHVGMIIYCRESALANSPGLAFEVRRYGVGRGARKNAPDETTSGLLTEKADEMRPRIGVSLIIGNELPDTYVGSGAGKVEAEHFGMQKFGVGSWEALIEEEKDF